MWLLRFRFAAEAENDVRNIRFKCDVESGGWREERRSYGRNRAERSERWNRGRAGTCGRDGNERWRQAERNERESE